MKEFLDFLSRENSEFRFVIIVIQKYGRPQIFVIIAIQKNQDVKIGYERAIN